MIGVANRYQVLAPLARGGMGEILLARRLGPAGFEKLVVLKRPLPHLAGSGPVVESLVEEARLLARINHPNVCQVYDLEETEGHYYLALEYLEGLSLWTLLASCEASGRAMDPRAVCGLIDQACDGLDAIHALIGAIHRDISPGNLMLTEAGAVKILDLGIAKTAESADLTPFGRVKGKLPYVAPEQARGLAVDARADVFALGLVTYDLARGRRPGDRIGALAADSLDLAEMPPALADVIRTATAIEPAGRFATARDMGSAIRRAGAALGGSYDRAALATWLAANFLSDVTHRRAWLEEALHGAAPGAEPTQILSLRSLLPVDDPPLPPPIPRPRETERLELPDHERIARHTGRLTVAAADRIPAPARTSHPDGSARLLPPHTSASSSSSSLSRIAAPAAGRSRRVALVIGAILVAGLAFALVVAYGGGTSADPTTGSSRAAASPAITPAPTPEPPAAEPMPPPPPTEPASSGHVAIEPAAIEPSAPPPAAPSHGRHDPVHRSAKAEPGQLTVGSTPYATVRLGGRKLGQTPLYRLAFPPGRYRLHATTEDGREQDVSVVVEAGREAKLRLDWK